MAYYTQGQGLISQRRGNASYFYHYDGLGSTKALTDSNQNIQASYKYDAWGNILQTSGTITNPYLYVGELCYYADGDSGMYLLTQRWYNPVIGRFVVRDPLDRLVMIAAGGHKILEDVTFYLYIANNPVNTIDPSGLVDPRIIECNFRYRECVKKANEAYNECYCEIITSGERVPWWIRFGGCFIICFLVCGPYEEVSGIGALCEAQCHIGCEGFVERIPYLFLGQCRRKWEKDIEECHWDFWRCRGQFIGPYYPGPSIGPYFKMD